MIPVVAVLLSTYNGEKYIREQIDSVLAQEDVDVRIIIRDDGSHDSTIDILKDYQSKFPNIKCLFEDNVGAETSFHRLCQYAKDNILADYYAFCDQDDVWDNNKIEVAVQRLRDYPNDSPNLYFSNLKMVDSNLNYIRDLFNHGEVKAVKDMALVQIFTYGCTCVFNRVALEMYCIIEQNKTYHDNWVYVLCSYMGNVCYDPVPHISYRQHGANLSGAKETGLSLAFHRFRKVFSAKGKHDFEVMAKQLLHFDRYLSGDDLKMILRVANYRQRPSARLWLLFSPKYKADNWFKNLCICYRILFNAL